MRRAFAGVLLACLLGAAGCGDEESTTEVDADPPARVTDLTIAAVSETTVTLAWTAPGDDGDRGRAAQYDVRRHATAIDDTTWLDATPVGAVPEPGQPGSAETLVVRGFLPGTTAEFALRAADEVPNWSEISNDATGTTLDNAAPVACLTVPQTAGTPATAFDFDASCSSDEEDTIDDLIFSWDWDDDGVFDIVASRSPEASHRYDAPGEYRVTLEVEDRTGLIGRVFVAVTVVDGDLLVLPNRSGDVPTIQDAVEAAEDGDVIVLWEGMYAGSGNRDIDFGVKAVTVRSRTGRPETCIISIGGGPAASHRGMLFRSKESSAAVVEGITFSGGWEDGGGIQCVDGSSPTITNCVFKSNIGPRGAGLACLSSSPVVTGCVFYQNAGLIGGAGVHLVRSVALFSDCEFRENSGGAGAGILAENSDFRLMDCEFIGNAGGAINGFNSFPIAERCVFAENSAAAGGAALFAFNDAGLSARFIDCVFTGNRSTSGGGAIHSESGVSATGCEFSDNASDSDGGAVSVNGAHLDLAGCTLAGNTAAGDGGAVFVSGGSLDVRGCSLALNTAELGGGFALRSESVGAFANTIISANLRGGAVHCASSSEAVMACCDIWGNIGGNWSGCVDGQLGMERNISEDPLFCDLFGRDLALEAASPCHPDSNECGLIGARPVACGGGP